MGWRHRDRQPPVVVVPVVIGPEPPTVYFSEKTHQLLGELDVLTARLRKGAEAVEQGEPSGKDDSA